MSVNTRTTILIVNDDEPTRRVTRVTLSRAGYALLEAANGEQAIALARNSRPDLIVLDIDLPDMSGIEICRRIKADLVTRSILVLFLTASFTGSKHRALGLEMGGDGYLTLPVEPDELLAHVKALLRIRRAESDLQETRQRLDRHLIVTKLIASYAAEALFMLDKEGKLTFMNPAAEELLGWKQSELLGKNFHEQVHYQRPDGSAFPESECPLITALTSAKVVRMREDYWIRQDGSFIPVFCSCAPIISDGEVIGAVLTMTDITERKKAEQERALLLQREQAARQQAETASRLKDEFLATVSHELRTPLTAILGWVKLIRSNKLDQETFERALVTIERNVNTQNQLIEDLLDISRIITGKLRLESQPIDLCHVVEAAINSVRPSAEAKQLKIRTDLINNPPSVRGDSTRLQQVIWNLLSNAVKFTPKDGLIEVRLQKVDDQLKIIIADNGQGISADFLPFVFDRFRQADSTITRKHGGLGLGLSIVQQLVELHQGSVSVDSAGVGKGATFTVSLPIAHADQSFDEPVPLNFHNDELDSDHTLAGLKLLVIEDELDSRNLLEVMLEQYGATVQTMPNAIMALDLLKQWRPDLIISDIGLPGMSGYQFLEKLRSMPSEAGGNIPAIALTAYARQEDRINALAVGFQRYLSKPIEPEQLINEIANLVAEEKI